MEQDPVQRGGKSSIFSEKVSASKLQMYLKGMDYPAGKEEILQCARENDAPDNVMSFLRRLPEMQYNYPTDVEKEFGKMK